MWWTSMNEIYIFNITYNTPDIFRNIVNIKIIHHAWKTPGLDFRSVDSNQESESARGAEVQPMWNAVVLGLGLTGECASRTRARGAGGGRCARVGPQPSAPAPLRYLRADENKIRARDFANITSSVDFLDEPKGALEDEQLWPARRPKAPQSSRFSTTVDGVLTKCWLVDGSCANFSHMELPSSAMARESGRERVESRNGSSYLMPRRSVSNMAPCGRDA